MKRPIAFFCAVFMVCFVLTTSAYCGWKENYREKYSKQTLDPNSEKAQKIRRLCNFNFEFAKCKKPVEGQTAQAEKPKATLTENLMPWKKADQDKFQGYTTNICPARKNILKEEKPSSGNTLSGCLKSVGEKLSSSGKYGDTK